MIVIFWVILGALTYAWILAGVEMAKAGQNGLAAFALAALGSMLFVTWLSYRRGKNSAIASAVARAEARAYAHSVAAAEQHSQQAVIVNVDTGARATAQRMYGDLDHMEWIDESVQRVEIDGADLQEDVLQTLDDETRAQLQPALDQDESAL